MGPSHADSTTPSALVQNGQAVKLSSAPAEDVVRTKILLLGTRRSGKTSIQRVLFNGMHEKDTFFLEKTSRVTKYTYDTIIPLEIWDTPGNTTVQSLGAPLAQFASLIFVIDIQDSLEAPIAKLVDFIISAHSHNPAVNVEVFVHKSDTMSDQYYRVGEFDSYVLRQIQQRVLDELLDISMDYETLPIVFSLTSVYDHTVHEAFSRALHRVIGSLPFLEELLNGFCTNSQASKAFLLDVRSRLYVATDASPVDSATHGLVCDFLHMLSAFGPLYQSISASPARMRRLAAAPHPTPGPAAASPSALTTPAHTPHIAYKALPTLSPRASPSGGALPLPGTDTAAGGSPTSTASTLPTAQKDLFYPSASTTLSAAPATTMAYHLITAHLALVTLLPSRTWEERRGLVEYNVVYFREGVREIWEVEWEMRCAAGAGAAKKV